MKKAISLLLALVLCLSLCACGGGTKLTEETIKDALSDCDGTLNVETSGDNVTGFTFIVEGVNADGLVDKEYSREAIKTVASGDQSKITFGQYKVAKAFVALMSIDVLFEKNEDGFDSDAFVEKLLETVCDGKPQQYDGWTVTAEVDQASDSVTISVMSK